MSRFSHREYVSADVDAINQLYFEVTGRQRGKKEYLWQWHQSPSGSGDIWLIHDKENGKLIGHHGVMPIRFTKRDQDFLFGKIENTMVLPEYRSKILYPRYELRFKQAYQERYHALFATMGPDPAIRIRKATGYSFPVEWGSYLMGTSFLSNVHCLFFIGGKIRRKLAGMGSNEGADVDHKQTLDGFLVSHEVASHSFFDEFWANARPYHGVAPRRERDDLKWRFWTNPYKRHYTMILDSARCNGYAIVSIASGVARLEDYAVDNPGVDAYRSLFRELADRLASNQIYLLQVTTTNDEALSSVLDEFTRRQVIYSKIHKKVIKQTAAKMPRFVTSKGIESEIEVCNWHLTGLVFEGR